MKISFLTLFPRYYEPFLNESITKKAIERNLISIDIIDFRNHSLNKHNKVDDTVYGGGKGMLLKIEPIDNALKDIKGRKILLSPQGKKFNQNDAKRLAKEESLIFISGRYEGFDERILNIVDEEFSIGDYVLTGGELPSMVIADSVIRLVPGVIKEESHINESFENNLLDFPQYTKPRDYKGMKVPEVLLNGNHEEIRKWRIEKQLEKTRLNRPDLLEGEENEK